MQINDFSFKSEKERKYKRVGKRKKERTNVWIKKEWTSVWKRRRWVGYTGNCKQAEKQKERIIIMIFVYNPI